VSLCYSVLRANWMIGHILSWDTDLGHCVTAFLGVGEFLFIWKLFYFLETVSIKFDTGSK
jgi:hypothetical protein